LQCRNSKRHCNYSKKKVEPDTNEFVSAMAAGINAQLIVEVTLSVSPITIALAAAARQTKGRLICILPEPFLTESSVFIKESGLADFVDFVIGDPSEILARYINIDFAVIDCRIVNYAKLLKQLDFNLGKAAIVANNLRRGDKGLGENLKWVKDQKVSVKSLRHFIGKGMEVMTIGARDDQGLHRKILTNRGGYERFRGYNTMKRKSHWVKKVDEVSGEEHIFRIV